MQPWLDWPVRRVPRLGGQGAPLGTDTLKPKERLKQSRCATKQMTLCPKVTAAAGWCPSPVAPHAPGLVWLGGSFAPGSRQGSQTSVDREAVL